MCQLTLIHVDKSVTNSVKIARSFLNIAATTNAYLNDDGFGFYSNKVLVRTQLPGNLVINIGELSEKCNSTIMCHVRKASFNSPAGGKKLGDEFAHPFESKYFILAHNGSLEFRVEPIDKKPYENKIDSQVFLDFLTDEYEKTNIFETALDKALEQFYGKFAFIIYEKPTNSYYVVRGSSAELNYYPFLIKNLLGADEQKGFIINTEKLSLEKIIICGRNFSQIFGFNYVFDPKLIVPIAVNSAFRISDSLVELKTNFKEETKPVVVIGARKYDEQYGNYGYSSGTAFGGGNFGYSREAKIRNYHRLEADNFMREWSLSLHEIDWLVYLTFRKPLLELEEDEWETFLLDILKKLSGKISGKRALWNKAYDELLKVFITPRQIYSNTDLTFPYFLEKRGPPYLFQLAEIGRSKKLVDKDSVIRL